MMPSVPDERSRESVSGLRGGLFCESRDNTVVNGEIFCACGPRTSIAPCDWEDEWFANALPSPPLSWSEGQRAAFIISLFCFQFFLVALQIVSEPEIRTRAKNPLPASSDKQQLQSMERLIVLMVLGFSRYTIGQFEKHPLGLRWWSDEERRSRPLRPPEPLQVNFFCKHQFKIHMAQCSRHIHCNLGKPRSWNSGLYCE